MYTTYGSFKLIIFWVIFYIDTSKSNYYKFIIKTLNFGFGAKNKILLLCPQDPHCTTMPFYFIKLVPRCGDPMSRSFPLYSPDPLVQPLRRKCGRTLAAHAWHSRLIKITRWRRVRQFCLMNCFARSEQLLLLNMNIVIMVKCCYDCPTSYFILPIKSPLKWGAQPKAKQGGVLQ